MPVVNFDITIANTITAGERRWFVLRPDGVTPYVVDDVCRHRGGPLRLGELCDEGGRTVVRCPWHGRCSSVGNLTMRALPLVTRGRRATVVLPPDLGRPLLQRRTITAVVRPEEHG